MVYRQIFNRLLRRLFIAAEDHHQVPGRNKAFPLQAQHGRRDERDFTLDVECAASEKVSVFFRQRERVPLPVRPVGRDDVHMRHEADGAPTGAIAAISHNQRRRFLVRDDVNVSIRETGFSKTVGQRLGEHRNLTLPDGCLQTDREREQFSGFSPCRFRGRSHGLSRHRRQSDSKGGSE